METTKVTMKMIEVRTESYRWTHGRMPRGKGQWGFAIGNRKEAEENPDKVFWSKPFTLYTEAVKEAKKEAQKKGVITIYVLP